jgi:hypothetical protein
MSFFEVLRSIFGSTLMTAYVFPVCIGVAFAFLTAKILEFHNVKVRTEIELRKIKSPPLWDFKAVSSNHEFIKLKSRDADPIQELADELGIRRHYVAQRTLLRLKGELHTLPYEALLNVNASTFDGQTYRTTGRALSIEESMNVEAKYRQLIQQKYEGWSKQVVLLRFEWFSLLRHGKVEQTRIGRFILTMPVRLEKFRKYLAGETNTWS